MFNIGDKVVYPMHGAGVIEGIEEREISGAKMSYYIIKLPLGDMRAMVPLEQAENVGLRQVVAGEELRKVLEDMKSSNVIVTDNWNHRYRSNLEKIKNGSIHDIVEVVHTLTIRNRQKGLSTGEKKMFENARKLLISELVLAQNIEEDQALEILESYLC